LKTSKKNNDIDIIVSLIISLSVFFSNSAFAAGIEKPATTPTNKSSQTVSKSPVTSLPSYLPKDDSPSQSSPQRNVCPSNSMPNMMSSVNCSSDQDNNNIENQSSPSSHYPGKSSNMPLNRDDPSSFTPESQGSLLPPVSSSKKSSFKYDRIENESKPIPGNIVDVYPEVSTLVYLSNSDVNRFKCSNGEVKDVIFSQEKGVKVQINGNSAFVKYLIGQNQMTQKKSYADVPTDFHVVCGDDSIYTIVGVPKTIPPQTIQLVNTKDKIKDNIELFSGSSIENKIGKFIHYAFNDEYPATFDVSKVDKHLDLFEKIDLYYLKKISIAGEGVTLKEFVLSLRPQYSKEKEIIITEKHFLLSEITKEPFAIALEPTPLVGTNKVRLFIIEKSNVPN